MKKLLSLAIMAILAMSATVLTSCDKSNDGYVPDSSKKDKSQLVEEKFHVKFVSYHMMFQHSDGEIEEIREMTLRDADMTAVEEKAFEAYNTLYAISLNEMQKKVDEQAKKFNNLCAVIKVTLINAQGDILIEKDITPGN